ncbi:hypothetical protein L3Y34_018399 [Caenorhabditis briggsae]|uniref:Uncharacterized protein n=3 Tax=Caenorhabditis briggsae TaxID=6238 RepID=A0AAE9DL87_CAEBR|nr:hypothetical protein L3Y34_018399 [Caenorhabditis briggsae]
MCFWVTTSRSCFSRQDSLFHVHVFSTVRSVRVVRPFVSTCGSLSQNSPLLHVESPEQNPVASSSDSSHCSAQMSAPFNFGQRPRGVIKQECLSANRLNQIDLIPEPVPSFELTLKQYEELDMRDSATKIVDSLSTRKLILSLMKYRPELWNKPGSRVQARNWKELGLDLFHRTGIFVNVGSLIHVFNCAKRALNSRMNKCSRDNQGVAETEAVMSQWELFQSFRFYYEFKTANRHFDDEDDDDIEFLGRYSQNPERRDPSPDFDYSQVYPDEPVTENFSSSPTYEKMIADHYQSGVFEGDQEMNHFEKKPRKRPLEISTDNDVEHVGYQMKRVLKENPEKEKLIRKAMFATILEFDDSNFHDLGDLFTSLAEKYKVADKKYNF